MVDGVSANIGVSAGAAPGQSASGSLPALTVLGGTNNLVNPKLRSWKHPLHRLKFAVYLSAAGVEFRRGTAGGGNQ